jgi:hypothetical protein
MAFNVSALCCLPSLRFCMRRRWAGDCKGVFTFDVESSSDAIRRAVQCILVCSPFTGH